MTEIQIEQNGISVPGMGGLNYDQMQELGWQLGMWLKVISEERGGVTVRLPLADYNSFIRSHEITSTRTI